MATKPRTPINGSGRAVSDGESAHFRRWRARWRAVGKAAGHLATDEAEAARRIAEGVDLVGVGADAVIVARAGASLTRRMHRAVEQGAVEQGAVEQGAADRGAPDRGAGGQEAPGRGRGAAPG